jgi:hypothetical protein
MMAVMSARKKPSSYFGPLARPATSGEASTFVPSDRERDAVVNALTRETAEGRIDYEELDRRAGSVLAAETLDDVNTALTGLPVRLEPAVVEIVPVASTRELASVNAPSASLPPYSRELTERLNGETLEVENYGRPALKAAVIFVLATAIIAAIETGLTLITHPDLNASFLAVLGFLPLFIGWVCCAVWYEDPTAVHNQGLSKAKEELGWRIAAEHRRSLLPAYDRFSAQTIVSGADIAVALIRWKPQHAVGEPSEDSVWYIAEIADVAREDPRDQLAVEATLNHMTQRAEQAEKQAQQMYLATSAQYADTYAQRVKATQQFRAQSARA